MGNRDGLCLSIKEDMRRSKKAKTLQKSVLTRLMKGGRSPSTEGEIGADKKLERKKVFTKSKIGRKRE